MLKKIFGNKNENASKKEATKSNISWIPLTSLAQIETIKEESKSGYIGIFKHSTRCAISKTVLQRLEEGFPEDIAIKMYYIDLLNYRDVSSEVGISFQVVHQSPQLLIIKDENSVLNASHYDIVEVNLKEIVK